MRLSSSPLFLLLLVLLPVSGCEKPGTARVDFRRRPMPGATGGTWVARFNGETLTDQELSQRFSEMNPYARARFQTVEQRRDYVDGLVRFELLAQEAVRQGLANDPEVVETAKRVMVQALLKKELEGPNATVSDAQVAEYYQAHVSDYVKPAMTRLSHIFFAKEHRAQAEAVLAQVKALAPLDYAAFAKLAREHSEDARTRELEGDLRFLSDEELAKQLGESVVKAAAALQKVGDVAPELVETEKGLHILKLQGRQIALNLSLEQARPSIQQVLLNETKQDRFRALLERLKKQSNFELNESALAALVVDPKAPATPPKAPQPGFIAAPPPPPATK
ncbi:MAG: peptidyl-prolyl cis-trans isomerase [Myxococcota bacterium]